MGRGILAPIGPAGWSTATIRPVTVAAVVLAASPESALADADGQPVVRRIADSAWAGGALPIVIVSFDPDGGVAAALAGTSTTLAEPVPKPDGAPVAQIARGISVARKVVSGVEAALIWPARMGWVGPETVTSLIEAHGLDRGSMLRPAFEGEPGWPVLLPLVHAERLEGIARDRMPGQIVDDLVAAGVPTRMIELGDPGVSHDLSVPASALPGYAGPPEPAAPHAHEWGAALADLPEDTPLAGPALAPYHQVSAEDPE
jgi:molybdenum cofactor cytidylyltransferase